MGHTTGSWGEKRMKNICKFLPSASQDELEILCFIYETNPEAMREQQKLPHHTAILVKQGQGSFFFDGFRVPIVPGQLVFGFRGEVFSTRDEAPCEYMYIRFDGARAESLLRRFGIHRSSRCFDGFEGMVPLWQESLTRASESSIDLASESMLLYAFSRMVGIPAKQNDLIDRMTQICEERFTDPELTLTAIVDELGYNMKYASHLFKARMGVGFNEYLRARRLRYAMLLFDQGLDSVKNVALLSGFSDPLYFSSVFRKSVGLSPSAYRDRRKERQS